MSTAEENLNFRSTLDDSQFQAAIGRMEVNIGSMTDQITNQNGELESFAKKAADLTNEIFSMENMANFVKAIVTVRNEYQQLELSFSTILKSKAAADDLMGGLSSFAGKTPFSLKESGDAAKQLLSYGSTTKDIVTELKTLGEVATGASVPIAELAAAYGSLKKEGAVSESDISEFAAQGIPIYQELAKVMGIGKNQISGLVAEGKIGFPEIEQAFQNMTASSGMFYGAMEAQSGTFGGQLETLRGAWESMLNSLGQDNEGLFSGSLSVASSLIENYEIIINTLGVLITSYGAYRAAVVLTSFIQLTAAEVTAGVTLAFKVQYYWTVLLDRANKFLNATMLANPYVLVATAIAGLIAVMYMLSGTVSAHEKAQRQLNEENAKAIKNAEELKSKVNELNNVLQDKNATDYQQSKAYAVLQSLYPTLFGNLSKEAYLRLGVVEAQKLMNKENERMEVEDLGKRYEDAKKHVESLKERVKEYQQLPVSPKENQDNVGERAANLTKEALRVAVIKAAELGNEYEKHRDSIRYTNMSHADRLTYLKLQKKELEGQRSEIEKFNKIFPYVDNVFFKSEKDVLEGKVSDVNKKIADETANEAANQESRARKKAQEKKDLEDQKKQRADILGKIFDINEKFNGSTRSDDDKKLDNVRKEFQSLREEIDSYNEKQKNKKLHINRDLTPQLKRALTSQEYENGTGKLSVQLDRQKILYDGYEEYKSKLGKDAADERYKKEIDTNVTFLQKMEADRASLLSKDPLKMTPKETDRLHVLDEKINLEVEAQQKKHDELIKGLISYEQNRRNITEKYNADFLEAHGNASAQNLLTENYKADLNQLDESQIKKWDSYKALFDHLEDLNKKELASKIQLLKEKVKAELAAGNITVDQAKKVNKEISAIERTKGGAGIELFIQKLQSVATEISGINNDIGSIIGSLAGAAASYISISKGIRIMNDSSASSDDKNAAKIGLYSQSANGLLSMITGITNAAAERKRVTEEFYKSAIDFQNQYNLTLIEQARLENFNKRGIFSKDSLGEIKDGLKASGMAMIEYQKKIDDLHKGQAKVGLRNAVNWKSTGSMIAGGVGAGAAIGSVIPGIGTAIGAVIGGVVGFIGGLFGTKKKKDTYAGLLTEFPELILKGADGTRLLNTGLAQQLIAQNQVNEATKQYLQAAIDAEKELQKSRDQVNEGIKTLVGSIDDDLRNALVSAFRAGEDGMKAFEGTVAKSMENIIANLAFQAIFNDAFIELEKSMKTSFSGGGDSNIVDDLEKFYKSYGGRTKEFNAALEAAKSAAKKEGIDLFGKDNQSVIKPTGLTTSLTQDTGEKLEGLWRGQFDLTKQTNITAMQHLLIAKSNFDTGLKIEANTFRTANNTENLIRLVNIENALISIDTKTSSKTTRD